MRGLELQYLLESWEKTRVTGPLALDGVALLPSPSQHEGIEWNVFVKMPFKATLSVRYCYVLLKMWIYKSRYYTYILDLCCNLEADLQPTSAFWSGYPLFSLGSLPSAVSARHPNSSIGPHMTGNVTNQVQRNIATKVHLYWNFMGVSENRDTSKWMVYNGKPYWKGWFGGTIIFGNTYIFIGALQKYPTIILLDQNPIFGWNQVPWFLSC